MYNKSEVNTPQAEGNLHLHLYSRGRAQTNHMKNMPQFNTIQQ